MSVPPDAPTPADGPATTDAPAPAEAPGAHKAVKESTVLGSSAVMAAGTVFSRLSGYLRGILLAAALGTQLHAELFTIANTIPNMVYILLAGGVFNAVLVPQLVRAMKNDPDGGAAYINRIVTLAALFLGLVTVILVIAAPWVMSIYLDDQFDTPQLAEQRDSIIAFARYCLPQVFFYGMFVLVGQILNSRHRFGPMMWAPIVNNVIAVGVLIGYLAVYGPVPTAERNSAYAASQELVLGVGSTLGIVGQFLVLLPFLRAAGVRYRPRFDFLGTGLGHTLRLGTWTVAFVIVNQIAYTVVVRLASGGTLEAAQTGELGTGYTIYSQAFLIMMAPHAVVTVSLTTAILPRLSRSAASGDLRELSTTLISTLRLALAFMVPVITLVPVVGVYLANVIWGYGAARDSFELFVPSLVLFGPAMVFFTIHYLTLRGFYALEQTRRVFLIQCVIATVNIVMAILLVRQANFYDTAPALVTAYGLAYGVGACVSFTVLARTVGGLQTGRTLLFAVRLALAAALAMAASWALRVLVLDDLLPATPSQVVAGLCVAVLGVVHLVVLLLAAWLLRIDEVRGLVRTIAGRLRRSA